MTVRLLAELLAQAPLKRIVKAMDRLPDIPAFEAINQVMLNKDSFTHTLKRFLLAHSKSLYSRGPFQHDSKVLIINSLKRLRQSFCQNRAALEGFLDSPTIGDVSSMEMMCSTITVLVNWCLDGDEDEKREAALCLGELGPINTMDYTHSGLSHLRDPLNVCLSDSSDVPESPGADHVLILHALFVHMHDMDEAVHGYCMSALRLILASDSAPALTAAVITRYPEDRFIVDALTQGRRGIMMTLPEPTVPVKSKLEDMFAPFLGEGHSLGPTAPFFPKLPQAQMLGNLSYHLILSYFHDEAQLKTFDICYVAVLNIVLMVPDLAVLVWPQLLTRLVQLLGDSREHTTVSVLLAQQINAAVSNLRLNSRVTLSLLDGVHAVLAKCAWLSVVAVVTAFEG